MSEDQAVDVPQGSSAAGEKNVFDCRDPMFTSDHFRMYEMKITRCPRARPHDWTLCPYSHPGEKAKRRDPRKFTYSGTACAEYRKTGQCARGDACTFSHGVFECHLHPARYRTQLCTDGLQCKRRVCFFAHQESELRRLPDGTPVPGTGSPSSGQIQTDFSVETSLLQGQANLAQALNSYIDMQTRARQEEAITAAAQLLDPMAKLRLLHALQGPSASLTGGISDGGAIDPALLAALSSLNLASSSSAAPARHSIDGGYSNITPPNLGQFATATAPLPPLGRRSIDIGSLSRVPADPFASAAATLNAAAKLHAFTNGGDSASSAAAMINSMAGGGAAPSSAPPTQLFGSLPTSSFMDFAAGLAAKNQNGGAPQSPPNGDAFASAGNGSDIAAERSLSSGGGPLQSIDELGPIPDEESVSSASVVARSVSAGSSLDQSGKEVGSTSGNNGSASGSEGSQVPRVMSFDNILAELPRSASQVNMMGLGLEMR